MPNTNSTTTDTSEVIAAPSKESIARALELMRDSRNAQLSMQAAASAWETRWPNSATFVEATRIPVVATLKGLGALPTTHELALGMMGMHGIKAANHAVQSCDLLICVGARFDDRATGRLNAFAPHAKVIHLDVDRAEISKLRRADVPVIGNLRHALKALSCKLGNIEPWRRECTRIQKSARMGLRRAGHGSVRTRLSEGHFRSRGTTIASWLAMWASTRCGSRNISISTGPRST